MGVTGGAGQVKMLLVNPCTLNKSYSVLAKWENTLFEGMSMYYLFYCKTAKSSQAVPFSA